jgi:hypothetical protein
MEHPMSRPRARRIRARITAAAAVARQRLREDAGYTTETVIVTALLAAAALTIIAIIVAKILGAANGINV